MPHPQVPTAHPAHTSQADLIGTAKETHKDLHKRDELHRQWAEQQDAKDLQQVLRGLKHGFRRRGRGGFMEEEVRPEGLGWAAGNVGIESRWAVPCRMLRAGNLAVAARPF